MTDDLTRPGDVQLAQTSSEATPSQEVVDVSQPPKGGEIILPSLANRVYDLRFDPRLAQVRVIDADGDQDLDVVLLFNAGTPDESRIVFVDMVEAAQSGSAPMMQVGEALFGADLVVQQAQALASEQPTLETAAPAGPEAEGTGASQYDDNLGALIDLLSAQGTIQGVESTFPSLGTTVAEDDLLATEPLGLLVVGSNADDEDGQQEPHRIPNPNDGDSGPILGGPGSDTLIGDPGGTVASGQFNVAIAVDVSGSIGPENIATLNAAVEDFVQQIIDRDIADRTVIRLITFAVRTNQTTSGLEFGKTFTWDGSQFVAADDQSLADAIDAEVANPGGSTDFEPSLQDAADFFNGLNGGTGPADDDVNRTFFLTDGKDNSGPGDTFDPNNLPDLYGPTGLIAQEDLQIRVFGIESSEGVNSGFDPDQLNLLDDGLAPQPGEALHTGQSSLVDQVEEDVAVIGFDDVDSSLTGALLASLLDDVGGDVINGGDGNDVIFGDVPNTDALALAEGIDLPPASGFLVFEALEAGQSPSSPGWDRGTTTAYLRDPANQSDLIGAGRGEGDSIDGGDGNDVIFGQGGDDSLTGGTGADTYVYTLAADEDDDEILDFSTADGDLLSFVNVADADSSGTIGIEDVVDSFVDGGGAGAVDTLVLGSGTTIMITDVNGTLTDLASLDANSLINGV